MVRPRKMVKYGWPLVVLVIVLVVGIAAVQSQLAGITVIGSFQSELGCSGDWQPDCDVLQLRDVDGDGVYTLRTTDLPAGEYEARVAVDVTLDGSLGADSRPDGDSVWFMVPVDGAQVTLVYSANPPFVTASVRELG